MPAGVELKPMRCALKGHLGKRAETATCGEIFDEFDVDKSGDLDIEEVRESGGWRGQGTPAADPGSALPLRPALHPPWSCPRSTRAA